MFRLLPSFLYTMIPLTFFYYLDPGTGSLLVQAAVAAVSGLLFFFGTIKQFFINLFSTKKTTETDVDGEN